jgi:hypothetical protein
MTWTADISDEDAAAAGGTQNQAPDTADAGNAAAGSAGEKTAGSKRSIILILTGLAVIGAAAGWDWLRKLPKD